MDQLRHCHEGDHALQLRADTAEPSQSSKGNRLLGDCTSVFIANWHCIVFTLVGGAGSRRLETQDYDLLVYLFFAIGMCLFQKRQRQIFAIEDSLRWPALHLRYKAAIVQLELRKRTSRTSLALQSCEISSWSCGSATLVVQVAIFLNLPKWSCASTNLALSLHYNVVVFEVELQKCTLRTTLAVLSSWSCYTCEAKFRFSSWSCGSALRVLHL